MLYNYLDDESRQAYVDLRDRCDKTGQKYPTYFCVDNCCAEKDNIQSIFRSKIKQGDRSQSIPEVTQDGKHLINRNIETCSTKSSLYAKFTKDLHGAVFVSILKVIIFRI